MARLKDPKYTLILDPTTERTEVAEITSEVELAKLKAHIGTPLIFDNYLDALGMLSMDPDMPIPPQFIVAYGRPKLKGQLVVVPYFSSAKVER